jgi:hypothetical protein
MRWRSQQTGTTRGEAVRERLETVFAHTACSPSQVKRIWAIHLATQPKHAE